ncbi:hypothetical protein U1Q18_050686 [Sarracenia purpurea var. burkii]
MNQTGKVEESAEDINNTGINEPQEIKKPRKNGDIKLGCITHLPPLKEPMDRKYLWQCLLGAASAMGCYHNDLEMTETDRKKLAIDLVQKSKLTYDQARFWTEVPKSTVSDHITGKSKKFGRGRYRLLTEDQERVMAEAIRTREIRCPRPTRSKKPAGAIQERFMKITHKIAVDLKIKPLITKKKIVGRKWFASFMRRHELYSE